MCVCCGMECGTSCDVEQGSVGCDSARGGVNLRYEMCDMARNDGLTWNVVWFGMSEMVFDVE